MLVHVYCSFVTTLLLANRAFPSPTYRTPLYGKRMSVLRIVDLSWGFNSAAITTAWYGIIIKSILHLFKSDGWLWQNNSNIWLFDSSKAIYYNYNPRNRSGAQSFFFFGGGGSDSVLLHRPTTGQDTQSCRSFLASSNRWEDAENEWELCEEDRGNQTRVTLSYRKKGPGIEFSLGRNNPGP